MNPYIESDDSADEENEVDIDTAIEMAADEFEEDEMDSSSPVASMQKLNIAPSATKLTSAEEADTIPTPSGPSTDLFRKALHILKINMICVVCQGPGQPDDYVVCSGCGKNCIYHKWCWDRCKDHQLQTGPSLWGDPCEKTEMTEYVWISYLLNSNISPKKQESLHRKDLWATWFGVPYNQTKPLLYTYSRLQALLQNHSNGGNKEQYPSLVSFFGDTGGGKSTLIRALIRNANSEGIDFETPVPGNQADLHKSTSGDVHLYADPLTISTKVPLLYADCEGLRGSGQSSASRLASGQSLRKPHLERRTLKDMSRNALKNYQDEIIEHKETSTNKLHLQWASCTAALSTLGTSSTGVPANVVERPHLDVKSQGLIVRELYPRLLYTFSDVVCYITNNPRATEADIQELFQWASSGHERTVNQRIRPGLLIVINKLTGKADPEWLNVDYATEKLLSHLELSGAFSELKDQWAKRGKTIRTAQDLILCYYASFRVICVPDLPGGTAGIKAARYVAEQYRKLYWEICLASRQQRDKKISVGMNPDVESFNTYVEHAFNRLSRDLKSSIDFYYLSSRDETIPSKVSEHLTALIVKMLRMGNYGRSNELLQEEKLLRRLIPYLAWCIGMQIQSSNEAPTESEREELITSYMDEVQTSLEVCRERHWRCEALSLSGSRCCNHWDGHEKGHQFSDSLRLGPTDIASRGVQSLKTLANTATPTLTVGNFESSVSSDKILSSLYEEISRVLQVETSDRKLAFNQTARGSGVADVISNRTCFACLSNCPVYILPCNKIQHTICEACVERFSTIDPNSTAVLALDQCPLGCPLTTSPWMIRRKPLQAGVRILTLDGGGIRGIIELAILQRVLREVGHGIPIQELFDLAIGTSAGGIIALGLFKMDWTVDDAISKFVELSKEAFSPRRLLRVPGFKNAAQMFCSYRYESSGIEHALQKAFGTSHLFGQRKKATADQVKVGVIAAEQSSSKPYLFTNYARNHTPGDYLQRADNPKDDLLVWQAARATSAAPIYFSSYHHFRTRKHYVDGAILRNNPVRITDEERRLIWKNGNNRADIVLSLGSGVQTNREGDKRKSTKQSKTKYVLRMVPKGLRKKITTSYHMVTSTLDCEREWHEFVASVRDDKSFVRVCHRLNVGLEEKPPKLDDIEMMGTLQYETDYYFSGTAIKRYINREYKTGREHIQAVASRLVASLFYFEEVSLHPQAPLNQKKLRTVSGLLRCRLSHNMEKQFAFLVASKPEFRICERGSTPREISCLGFDMKAFCSTIEFLVSGDAWIIEVSYAHMNWNWEAISGFS